MYVTGNPIRYNDPTGHVFDDGSDDRLLARGRISGSNTRPRHGNSSKYADSTEGILSGPARGFGLPFPKGRITWYHGFGNTQFADEHQRTWYRNTCGKHCGIDFVVPYNTPLYWMGTGLAIVYAVDALDTVGNLRGFRAGPHNIVLKYGEYYIIFGHTTWDKDKQIVKAGDVIYPGQLFGWTGDTDGDFDGKQDNNAHLHLEIRPVRGPDWSIVINPAFFFQKDLYQLLHNSTYSYSSDQGAYSIYLYSMITCKATLFYGGAQ